MHKNSQNSTLVFDEVDIQSILEDFSLNDVDAILMTKRRKVEDLRSSNALARETLTALSAKQAIILREMIETIYANLGNEAKKIDNQKIIEKIIDVAIEHMTSMARRVVKESQDNIKLTHNLVSSSIEEMVKNNLLATKR